MRLNQKAIVEVMAHKRMTQAQLADRSGLAKQSVSLILARGTCTVATLGKLADGLGVSAAELVESRETVYG